MKDTTSVVAFNSSDSQPTYDRISPKYKHLQRGKAIGYTFEDECYREINRFIKGASRRQRRLLREHYHIPEHDPFLDRLPRTHVAGPDFKIGDSALEAHVRNNPIRLVDVISQYLPKGCEVILQPHHQEFEDPQCEELLEENNIKIETLTEFIDGLRQFVGMRTLSRDHYILCDTFDASLNDRE